MDISDGSTIILGSTTVALLVKEGFAWLRSRNQKTTITPDPINVKPTKEYVTVDTCNRLMCAHDAQLSEIKSDVKNGMVNILHKLEAMDRKSEERAIAAHNRIEPLVKEISKNIGQVELIKESFLKSTIGGRK